MWRKGEQLSLGENSLGILHLLLNHSLPSLLEPAGWGAKNCSARTKGLTELICMERTKELNVYSSAKRRQKEGQLNVYKYLKCVNMNREINYLTWCIEEQYAGIGWKCKLSLWKIWQWIYENFLLHSPKEAINISSLMIFKTLGETIH